MSKVNKLAVNANNEFLTDVLNGLSVEQKNLPCKYFYDDIGAGLFEQITELDEYYITRTELRILQKYSQDIARQLPQQLCIIEPGCGSGKKVAYLLKHIKSVKRFVPFEISQEMVNFSLANLHPQFPHLVIEPMLGDFTQPQLVNNLVKQQLLNTNETNLVFFPGSTLGNFSPIKAIEVLKSLSHLAGEQGYVLIGVDLVKDRQVLLNAYDDQLGVTAQFNKNLLQRINNELGGNFSLPLFRHESRFNEQLSRIEMHLISECQQQVKIADRQFNFDQGESIHTENSHKYTLASFAKLCDQADLSISEVYQDDNQYFALCLLRVNTQ